MPGDAPERRRGWPPDDRLRASAARRSVPYRRPGPDVLSAAGGGGQRVDPLPGACPFLQEDRDQETVRNSGFSPSTPRWIRP